MNVKNQAVAIFLMAILGSCLACNKLVQISPPVNSITTSQVFSDSANANSAVLGIYEAMIGTANVVYFMDGAISVYTGSSADELVPFQGSSSSPDVNEIYTNQVKSNNSQTLYGTMWDAAYTLIYQTNACIQGISSSSGISQSCKNELIGESEFLRALCYFYLVNLYGDVPYVTTIDYAQSSHAARTPKSQVYQQMVADLKNAETFLRADYSIAGGQKIRANQAAAAALLARVYLYQQMWDSAELAATTVLNNTRYSLVPDPNGVFLINSSEAILQWNLNTNDQPYNATPEGDILVPVDSTSFPLYYVSPQLFNAFEAGDRRKFAWLDSTDYQGTEYYYPYKYKIGPAQTYDNAPATEYYMVLRLAEQLLIRAEARAQQNTNLAGAIDDLNIIRGRAGLSALPPTLNRAQVLAAVFQERRVEFFAEWGHRWLDLKRTGAIDSVMNIVTPQKIGGTTWMSYQQLYPIYYTELVNDPNLKQNAGY